ncbi:hypothetical protein NTGBS_310025 [Candidatus Nitrotoga sp. BS]|nr:hypothetical protein NTGBS_310025 [Candidatus Nitrotoga sp. BS]
MQLNILITNKTHSHTEIQNARKKYTRNKYIRGIHKTRKLCEKHLLWEVYSGSNSSRLL